MNYELATKPPAMIEYTIYLLNRLIFYQ